MGKRNARNKIKISYLDEINYIDRRLKRVKNKEEEKSKLLKKREISDLHEEIVDSRDRGMLDNLTVFVNNEKYKII